MVISEFTKQSVHSKLKIPLEKIHLIYPGINHEFFSYTINSKTSTSSPSFIYYPARALPHKNHARLFEAMEIVRKKYPDLSLVLTGADGSNLGSLPSFVTHKGHITREEVRELYLTASCLVFPSLYEGFGFPPLEAMALGCPVVTSLSGSLKEICKNSAFVIDPLSPEDIARGILEALEEPGKYTQVGIENVAKFNWDIAAREHVELFEMVLEAN